MKLFTIAILPEEMRPEIAKSTDGIYDFVDAVDADYIPLYLVNLDTKHVIDSCLEVSEFHKFYEAFIEGIEYTGIKVTEGYGIWFTSTGEYENPDKIFPALADGLIEEAL